MKISTQKFAEYMIYLYIIVMMISGSTGALAVKIIRVAITFALVLDLVSRSPVRWSKSVYHLWTIVFLLYNIARCPVAFSKSYAIEYTITLFYVVIVNIFICQYICTHREMIISILKIFIVGAFLQSAWIYGKNGLLVFLMARATDKVSANTVGFYSAFATVFAIYFYLSERKKIYLIFAVISTLCMILSASRKAFLFLGIPLAFYYVLKSKNVIRSFVNLVSIFVVFAVAFVAILNVPVLYNLAGHRIEEMLNGLLGGSGAVDSSTSTRMALIEFGITYFKLRPWFGYGMSNFKALMEVYRSWGSVLYAHNNYVELLVDCGIVGTVAYYSLYIYSLICGLKNMKSRCPIQVLSLGCLLAFFVCEYGMVTYNVPIIQLLILVFFLILTDKANLTMKAEGEIECAQ